MDRQTRHDLKSDRFVQEVAHTVSLFEQHRTTIIRAGIALALVIVAGVGFYYFNESRRATRQADLAKAMKTYNALVTPGATGTPARSPSPPRKRARKPSRKSSTR